MLFISTSFSFSTSSKRNQPSSFMNTKQFLNQRLFHPGENDAQNSLSNCKSDHGIDYGLGEYYPYTGGRERLLCIPYRKRYKPGDLIRPIQDVCKSKLPTNCRKYVEYLCRGVQRTIEDLQKRHEQRVDSCQAVGGNSCNRHEKRSDLRRELERFVRYHQWLGG